MKDQYRYNLTSTHESSDKYGNCEICVKHCSEVFSQTEERHYIIDKPNFHHESWTTNKCNNYFGHENCLKNKQRN
jgi:hypothetical protein